MQIYPDILMTIRESISQNCVAYSHIMLKNNDLEELVYLPE